MKPYPADELNRSHQAANLGSGNLLKVTMEKKQSMNRAQAGWRGGKRQTMF